MAEDKTIPEHKEMEMNIAAVAAIVVAFLGLLGVITRFLIAPAMARRAAAKNKAEQERRARKRPGAGAALEKLGKWASGQETEY